MVKEVKSSIPLRLPIELFETSRLLKVFIFLVVTDPSKTASYPKLINAYSKFLSGMSVF